MLGEDVSANIFQAEVPYISAVFVLKVILGIEDTMFPMGDKVSILIEHG